MKWMKDRRATALVLLLALCMAPLAMAQDGDPFEIIGDVDNDGIIGPTDIQHVINGALGLNDEGPEAINRPLRQYIVASPRASLAPRPGPSGGECDVVGAATNFHRENGRLLVRAGTGIAFRFDRNVEGVWHGDACGLIRSELVLHIRRLEPGTAPGAAVPENSWEPLGRDGAAHRLCGPAVATANIGVRRLFETPGDFVVRSTIRTFAIPESEVVEEGERPRFCGAARDVDVVFTHVRVVDQDATEDQFRWQVDNDSPTIGRRFGDRLQNGEGEDVALP
ncbi:MAG: hypothetical protein KF886_20310 [Candidatus Hydrogenedentes bacterium]|nr:hypothetical protein [Candidatus Hydrogenedentota bacterium]